MDPYATTRPRSSRAHHGTLRKVRRHDSPDSACEQPDDPAEEMGGGGGAGRRGKARRSNGILAAKRHDGESKGAACQDSDVDSGIVACRPGQRIGSTSSADTDSSQESRRKEVEYSPPFQKSDLSRGLSGSQRSVKHLGNLISGPVKGDHSVLKECNRRPPTPLSVFPESRNCVRFDEQLHLSEQNIRRSCRKLFATLYAQRFSYPGHQSSYHSPHVRDSQDSIRVRSRTVPELELRRQSPGHSSVRGNKENLSSERALVQGRRASLGWCQTGLSHHKSNSDLNLSGKPVSTPYLQRHELQIQRSHTPSLDQNHASSCCRASTDSGLGSFRGIQCTCENRHAPSPSSTSQYSSSHAGPYGCTCACSCSKSLPRTVQRSGLIKSSSCSTLSAMSVCSSSSRPPSRVSKKTPSQFDASKTSSTSRSLQKISSCSNLLEQIAPESTYSSKSARRTSLRVHSKSDECLQQKTSSSSNLSDKTSNFHVTNVYNDSMIHAYARMASVVPEELKSATSTLQRPRVLGRGSYRTENIYDSIPSSGTHRTEGRAPSGDVCCNSRRNSLRSDGLVVGHAKSSEIKSAPSAEIYSQIANGGLASYGVHSSSQSVQNRTVAAQRPKSVGVVTPNCSPGHVYLKPALKKNTHFNGRGDPTSESQASLPTTEVEYAVVDKSRKNRFATSLPALNGYHDPSAPTGRGGEAEDKDHPPVPPKKMLHKSDFSLYRSRSSSPKKSLLERVQTLSKSARSALQKAFSTERIYRPEREERLEGLKTLQRSRSFIKTLTGSFRRKRRRGRTEVVTQASSDPQFDEVPTGNHNLVHVRGQLLQLNLDGSQVVELSKPPSKPYGFFVARGRVRSSKGIFVSRMRDQETQKQLAGILDIGDEILEIEGANVKNSDILEVNNLMANKNTLLLTVLPYICRKDI